MKQQINLFNPIFKKTSLLLSFQMCSKIIGIFFAVLLGILCYSVWLVFSLQGHYSALSGQTYQAAQQFSQVVGEIKPMAINTSLKAEITQLETNLGFHEQLIDFLKRHPLGNTKGFSSFLHDLAQYQVKGVWLTQLEIQEGGNELILKGSATSADLIPHFLETLRQSEVFHLLQLNHVALEHDSKQKYIHFIFSTHTKKKIEN